MQSIKKYVTVSNVLRAVFAAIMIFSSFGMIFFNPNNPEAALFLSLHLGPYILTLGLIKLIGSILLFIPKTMRISALVLTGYLGGAMMASIAIGEFPIFPAALMIILWIMMELKNKNFVK